MKVLQKMTALILCLLMLVVFAACNGGEENSLPVSSGEISSKEVSSVGEPVSELFSAGVDPDVPLQTDDDPYLTAPKATGDFIQSWLCAGWTKNKWDSYFATIKQAGYEFVIIQSTVAITDGRISEMLFENDLADNKTLCTESVKQNPECLGNALEAAKNNGMQVMIGLATDEDWWDGAGKSEWRKKQADLNNLAAKEIVDHYYDEYKDQIYGWYWVYEMWTQLRFLEAGWAEMFNMTRSYLSDLTPGLPVMVCPYYSAWENLPGDQVGEMWGRFFQKVEFEEGDIFCPQDGFGTQGRPLDWVEGIWLDTKKAMETYAPQAEFWLDVENFCDGGKSADVARYTKQLDICARIGEGLVSFSYVHYYDPGSKSGKYHKAYLAYLETIKDLEIVSEEA